jgi:hypothetical protein
MPRHRTRPLGGALCWITLALAVPLALSAHETKGAGALRLTIGWGDEPAFAGSKNSVDVIVSDASGTPVTDIGGSLIAEVTFGDQRIALPLQPSRERPGLLRAWLVPTRAGTYTFHITGTARGQAIDLSSTCSETTFHCVADVSELQFPAKDPSPGQLADGISRALPRTERAAADAARASTLGWTAVVMSALALAGTIGLGFRRAAKG